MGTCGSSALNAGRDKGDKELDEGLFSPPFLWSIY
jgi:hypothetical protein